jgi:hypothetical protein
LLIRFRGGQRKPTRSESEMAKWLDFVESILDRAIEHRKWVEGFVKKLAPTHEWSAAGKASERCDAGRP